MATPKLTTSGGLSPADGGEVTVVAGTAPVFTLNFQASVLPGEGQIIGLYNSAGLEFKAIQLRAVDKTVSGSVITYNHADGVVTFNGSVVTIQFKDVTWTQGVPYWITVGSSAIKDATGSFDVATAFGNSKWEFTIKDTVAPIAKKLYPADNSTEVPVAYRPLAITFSEDVKVANALACSGTLYPSLGDIAVYYSTDSSEITFQEGGDLFSLPDQLDGPRLSFWNNGVQVAAAPFAYPCAAFDSIAIDLEQAQLPSHAFMYVRVKPGLFVDAAGNAFAGINDNFKWNFSTKDDDFAAPAITATASPLCPESNFEIDFDNAEVLYLASTNKALVNGQDLSSIVKFADKNGDAVKAAVTFTLSTNTIVINPTANMTSALAPYTVEIAAGVIKDKSSNPSKAKSVTFAAGNWDAPVLDTAYVVNQSGTSFDIKIATNEPATVHYIVVRSDRAYAPTLSEVFGKTASTSSTTGVAFVDNASTADVYYGITSTTTLSPMPTLVQEGSVGKFYGKQVSTTSPYTFSMVEIFAEGDINIPTANFEVLERVKGLPATHGLQDDPQAKYEVYFALIDTIGVNNCTGPTSWYVNNEEHLSALQTLTQNVYTTNILMPEAWFDGDSATFTSTKAIKLNKDKKNPVDVIPSDLQFLARNGKIYINFNEEIRDNDGTELTAAEIKEGLFVYTGATAPSANLNSDVSWSSNHDFVASLSADKKQIIIESGVSWPSSSHVWVKIKNSRFEDVAGNEIVPYNGLYTQEFIVEDYIAPLVRYTYGNIDTPLDSLTKVKYLNYKDGEYTAAPIVVTISDKIYVGQGMNYPKGSVYTNTTKTNLVQFTSNPSDDQYIGNFFKIRNGASTANAGTSDPLELTDFTFAIDYTYGDSTKITITPKKQYASEYWYYIEIDNRIQDENFLTIAQGASVLEANKPAGFGWNRAYTGNAIEAAGWSKSVDPDTYTLDDNATIVFKAEDSRNPVLTFFSKQREDGIAPWTGSPINNIDGMTGIALTDTIGVYIDEYVGLGFDHYVHFDSITSTYTLDANAMRRYFKVFDGDSVAMDFDIVGLDTTALALDTLIFYIDPYYVDSTGQALNATETKNFAKNTKYTAYFNSIDADDQGTEDVSGKTKGIYWDDNNNLVVVTWAQFTTVADATPACVSASFTPAPGAVVNPATVAGITFNFANAVTFGSTVPTVTLIEGTSTVTTLTGTVTGAAGNIVNYNFPVALNGSSSYTVTIDGDNGHFTLNTGNAAANTWPANACGNTNNSIDSTWTFTTIDVTAPQLDTAAVAAEWILLPSTNFDAAAYGTNFLNPTDDSQGFDKTKDMVMVFDEEVVLVSGKAISIYNSARNKVATIYAQNCKYGVGADDKTDKHVIIIPSAYFANALTYTTNYHINVDAGFVTDATGNPWAGILAEDITANGTEDGVNDWSFQTGADPAPYFTKFSPANGVNAVSDLSITFSESVYASGTASDQITIYEVTAGNVFTPIDMFRPTSSAIITPNANKTVWTIDIDALETKLVYGKQYAIEIDPACFIDGNGSALQQACTTTGMVFVASTTYPVTDQTNEATATWSVNFRDDVAPTVLKTWPRDNYEHVPYNAYIYIQFSESVQFSDGAAIIPDPNPAQLIKPFITVQAGATTLAPASYDVEFVGNDKRMLRITPKDPAGYQYNSSTNNPTMQPATVYTVTIDNAVGIYEIADGELNEMLAPVSFSFLTEDIKAPVINNAVVNSIACDNKVSYTVNVTDESDTAVVYYAVMPLSTTTAPSADAIFSQNVTGAVKVGKFGVDANGAASNVTIDLGTNFVENPSFKIYAVATDLEKDIWKSSYSSDWNDTLFMFTGGYGEGYDRISDIMPAPNKSGVSTFVPSLTVWDNDAPTIAGSYPVSGQTEFPVGDSVRFWFSEAVVANQVAANIPDSVYLRRFDNNIAVSAAITWVTTGADADSAFYITPSEDLAQETKYYVEFDRYAIQDTAGVCPGNTVYFPQMIGRGFWFQTEDNIAPRLKNHIPDVNATCVACPNLNKDADEYISVFFYDHNAIRVNAAAADQYVRLYRANESTVNAWDVIPASLITIIPGSNDTTWEARIPLQHTYYPNDLIQVQIPDSLIEDIHDNVYASTIVWNYTTCNTDAPAVTTSILDLSGYFNYSEATSVDNGIFGKWNSNYDAGNAIGSVITDVPTHIALKVDFGEDVQINTSTTSTAKWEDLSTYEESNSSSALTSTELMKVLNISGLKYVYGTTFDAASDIRILSVTSRSIVFGFRNASNAKLPVYKLLADADALSNIDGDGLTYLEDYYEASLASLSTYKVTAAANKIRGAAGCLDKDIAPRYVGTDILTITTRDDNPANLSILNAAGENICGTTACVAKDEVITLSFDKPVVKSSYDVKWLGDESLTFDNLPLNASDLSDTDGSNYISFYQISTVDSSRIGDPIAVNVIALDDVNKMNFQIQPKNAMASEGLYKIVFNKHTVKNFIKNDPNGTVFDGDSCIFRVGDYLAPVVVDLTPDSGSVNVESSTNKLQVIFNEGILLGSGVAKVRHAEAEYGASVYAEFDAASSNVSILNKVATDNDTIVFNLPKGFEDFTTYYVEMPAGYVTDNNAVCAKNSFKGFGAKLGADGEMLSADWWFRTTDKSAPELISIVVDGDTILDEEGSEVGLFPIPGSTVAKDSKLTMVFDENIKVNRDPHSGIVIYYQNGDQGSFGNAVEFIPWSALLNSSSSDYDFDLAQNGSITINGSDVYNGLTSNVVNIDPIQDFQAKGIYYVRVNGDAVTDFSNNTWSSSTNTQLDEVKDTEWWFGVANDVAPVLVETYPAYDGVNKPRGYVTLGEGEADYGFVKADLSMTFYDETIANGGQPLNVAKGDSLRKVRIFEYTYDAASAQYKANPWLVLPITDPSITVEGNVVTLHDVILRDGINANGTSLTTDSVYYVTVDAGAILNGFSQSQTFWAGISNGFRWRFQTADDTVFVAGYDIVSPNIADDDSAAMDLTIDAAKNLVVEFEEAVAAAKNPTGKVQLFDEVGLVHEFTVTPSMCNGKVLTIPAEGYIKDETAYHVFVQAGAFNDGSNAGNPNFEFGGVGVWEFITGDNTNPAPVITPDSCIASNVTFTLTYNESKGITKGSGSIKVTKDSTLVAEFDVNDIEFTADSTGTKTVGTISLNDLADTTTYTLTIPAGFVFDGDETPLAGEEIVWNFKTADNTLPTAKVVTPVLAVTADTIVTIEFSELVTAVAGKFVTIGDSAYSTSLFETVDNITYTVAVAKLPSEVDCPVVFEAGSFVDVNAGCTPNGIADGFTTTFKVADISSPVAIGTPTKPDDYVGLEIALNFDDAVTKNTGNVKIYDAKNDSLIETIPVAKFTAASDSVYTYVTENVRFGEYYILMDAGSFVDNGAIEGFRLSEAIEKGDWSLVVSDTEFDCAGEIVYPTRGLKNVPLDTTIVISFCGERIKVGTKADRFVTIADQSIDKDYIYYSVVDSMIDGDKLSIAVSGLKENTTYSIIIAPGAITDEAGNEFVGIIDANTWFFTTGDFSTPVVTVTPDTVYNNASGKVTITSSEAGFVYFAQESVPATQQALLAAVQNDLAVAATIAANGSAELSTNGLKVGNYKAYAIDATGSIGVAENVVVVIDDILPLTTIAAIQGSAAASPLDGQKVRTKGTVTAIDKNGFYMQDANAAWSGVYVYSTQYAGEVSIGNSVEVIATVDEYNGLTELTSVESLEFVSKVITASAIEVPAAEALSEKYESVLVTVVGRATDAYTGTGDWAVNTGSQTVAISNYIYGSYSSLKDYKYQVTGVVYAGKNDAFKVEPRDAKDIINLSQRDGIDDLASQVKVYPNPFDKFISLSVSSDVVITKAVITNIAGQLVKEVINPSNSISTTELRSGVYFISLHTVDGIAKTERIIKR